MSPLFLLFSTALAGPYDDLRARAATEGHLAAGDTAVLVGLAGELGCVAAQDPMDCQALRELPPSDTPLLELVPVPALLLPAVGEEASSLLLPRFPYGLGEPVVPTLGPHRVHQPLQAWVRVPLQLEPPVPLPTRLAPAQALLLVRPGAIGPEVLSYAEPDTYPTVVPLLPDGGSAAEIWRETLGGYRRLIVALPLEIAAVSYLPEEGPPLQLSWSEAAPLPVGWRVLDPQQAERWRGALAAATALCWRAHAPRPRSRSRHLAAIPPIPPDLRLLVQTDEAGQIQHALSSSRAGVSQDLSTCLAGNARLLPAGEPTPTLGVLQLGPSAARAPAEP